jgi:hypothetical protein
MSEAWNKKYDTRAEAKRAWREANPDKVKEELAKRKEQAKLPISAEYVRERLDYDQSTGLFTWRVAQKPFIGKQAGNVRKKDGYVVVVLNARQISAHRLAWIYVHGAWPTRDLDHINRDRTDNRIANLRLSCDAENGQNKGLARNNKSGARGVHWCKTYNKWRAVIRVNWKLKHIGRFDTVAEAKAAYDAAAKVLHPFNSDFMETANG